MLHCYCALQAVCPVHLSSCTQMFVPFTHNMILCSIHICGVGTITIGLVSNMLPVGQISFSSWLWTLPWYCACAPFGDAHALFTLLTCMRSGHQGPSLLLVHTVSDQGFLEGYMCVCVCVGVFVRGRSFHY